MYGLSSRSFYQVINGSHHDDPVGSRIDLEVDIHIVASLDPFRLRADILIENTYKLLVGIILIINGFNLFKSHLFSGMHMPLRECRGSSEQDAG